MRKIGKIILLSLVMCILTPKTSYGQLGDLGFFGGISEGRKLPKSTEILLESTSKSKKNQALSMNYKEIVFLSGIPTEVEGILTVKSTGDNIDDKDIGTYTVNYNIKSADVTDTEGSISRDIIFKVNFRKEGNQIIKDYEVDKWVETITTKTDSFILDPKQSSFGVSILEDHTAGVIYYKGNISQRAVYQTGSGQTTGNDKTIHETTGDIYGYESVWSTTETHRINGTVGNGDWQMQYQTRPSVGVNKTLQYSKNEPTAISFDGNYREVMENISGLQYNIFMKPQQFYNVMDEGGSQIESYNTFEQLIAPDLEFLRGHFAEHDIKKLFAMQILEGIPKQYKPEQGISRSQYVVALVKAIKLPIEDDTSKKKKSKKKDQTEIIFPDITEDRSDFKYINAAYKKGLAIGKSNGYFHGDAQLTREEALVLLLRVVGLENLGLDPTPVTSFTDDGEISSWAKREIYAANRIGIIKGDTDGNIRPQDYVTKAEASALINRLITYMRHDMQIDYTENIVHYAD